MFRNCLQSVDKVASGADGRGCIVAHSMGLGKTLSTIAFLHTVLTNEVHAPAVLSNGQELAAARRGQTFRTRLQSFARCMLHVERCFAHTFAE